MKTHLLPCAVLLALFLSMVGSSGLGADLATKTPFKKDQKLTFPGFSVTYLGERWVANEHFPRGFLYQDFRIENGKETKIVSWSAGTGDIGPAPFQIAGR